MTARPAKIRADRLLFERGLADSREQAQALIMEGVVYTPAGRVLKAGSTLPGDVELEVKGRLPFVSRGGVKLANDIASLAPLSHAVNKLTMQQVRNKPSLEDLTKEEADLPLTQFDTKDYQEGYKAFLEKRRPNFIGE
ncbi:MAG: hypothetical protein J4N75_11900 [Chloroflexi bacterium]|nr:hypothetical protein [Chloroflexota bacterium]